MRGRIAVGTALVLLFTATTTSVAAQTGQPPARTPDIRSAVAGEGQPAPNPWGDMVKGLASGGGAALVALLGALLFTNRINANWEARKKRVELDITLARDFYRLVGSFKSIAREGAMLAQRLGAEEQPLGPVSEEVDTWHTDLLRRAIAAESDMEAVLMALVSEGSRDEGLTAEQWDQRIYASGLLRAAFRNLREQVEQKKMREVGFGHPLFWLMNRLQGELARAVFSRAVRKLRSPTGEAPLISASDYLRMIAYRTGDLEMATALLAPRVDDFFRARANARFAKRKKNVESLFRSGTYAIVVSHHEIPMCNDASIMVLISDEEYSVEALANEAEVAFERSPALTHFLFIGDHLDTNRAPDSKGAGVHAVFIKVRGQPTFSLCGPEQVLPEELPYIAEDESPARGVRLLAWTLDAAATKALDQLAHQRLEPHNTNGGSQWPV